MSVFVIFIGFVLFFTYKPLFNVLKVSKFKFESIKLELAKQETKKEFVEFAQKQANLLTNVVLKIVDLIAVFFGKKLKQEKQSNKTSSSAAQNRNNANAQSNAQDEQTPQQPQQNTTNAESSLDTTKK